MEEGDFSVSKQVNTARLYINGVHYLYFIHFITFILLYNENIVFSFILLFLYCLKMKKTPAVCY